MPAFAQSGESPADPDAGPGAGLPVTPPATIEVTDHPERRVRRPVDALRCVMSCLWIAILVAAAVAASATTTGAETDIVGASRRLPHAVLVVAPPIALFALFMLPAALALAQLIRRQGRRLVEAAATGVLAGITANIVNYALTRPAASRVYYAIIMSRPGGSHIHVLDPYLAGLCAYITMIGLAGRPGWRNAFWLAVGGYAIVQLTALHTTAASFLITVLAGRAGGLAIRYAAGSTSSRPPAREIAEALSSGAGLAVTRIRRVAESRAGLSGPRTGVPVTRAEVAGSRHYMVTTAGGAQLDVVILDRDQQAAGAFYRLYRWLRLRGQVTRAEPLILDRAVERNALLAYATGRAGVATPELRTLVKVGADAAALAYEHVSGTTLAQRGAACSEEELELTWDAVTRLHERHVTHRALTADRILFTPDGQVMLLDPGNGDVAASDLQARLDLAQLIVELALVAGSERAVALTVRKLSGSELVAVLPLLQPVALVRSTRHVLRRHRDVLPAVRKGLVAAVPGEEVTPVQLERIRPRALVTLVASVAAVYLLAGELAQHSFASLLEAANWRWGLLALALSVLTYAGATLSLSGFVLERLSFSRTLLVQLASSFITLVTPAAVGGVTLNVLYLQRRKIRAADAVASVAVSQVTAFVVHILLLATFAAIAGTGGASRIRPPAWAYIMVAGLVALAALVAAFPAGRRAVRARLSPTFGQVLPRLLEIVQHPRKLTEALGGTVLLSVSYIACLAACVAAFGNEVPLAKIGVVYLTGSALGSIIPTPGGLGAVEWALTAGLTYAGVPGGVALSAVLLFRLLTFWLPVPAGWAALSFLQRKHDLLPARRARRQRPRLAHPAPPQPRPPRRRHPQRRPAVPPAHLLAPRPGRLGRPQLPPAQARPVTLGLCR
ncbi:MAG TPA: lysylphosphatidylglycerol synthase transmembrane domain-containing protein [Trebonia sp.]|nr:lysylphosphatidylglycerol synthase transmembrane domain-containing protein [Trebonia sp.]